MAIESYDAASTNALLSLIDAPGGSKPSLATLTKLFKMLKQTKVLNRSPIASALHFLSQLVTISIVSRSNTCRFDAPMWLPCMDPMSSGYAQMTSKVRCAACYDKAIMLQRYAPKNYCGVQH
jgi:hypothetical protein